VPRTPQTRADAKRETRVALITAALAEFSEHGLDAPSLDAICARAGYTRGAFYVHFRNRADLMVAVVEYAMASFLNAVITAGDEAHDLTWTIDRFADAIAGMLERPRRGAAPAVPLPPGVPFARVLEAVTRDPRLRAGFTTLLQGAVQRLAGVAAHGQQAGTLRADVDPEQLSRLLVAIALGVMVAVDIGLPVDPPAARRTVLRVLEAPQAGMS
jgi:AcrR family transcriptional regulator